MKYEVLCGPHEWGIKLTREDGDGLAWDSMITTVQKMDATNKAYADEQCYRILKDSLR